MYLLAYGQVLGVEEAILKKSWFYVKSHPSLSSGQVWAVGTLYPTVAESIVLSFFTHDPLLYVNE